MNAGLFADCCMYCAVKQRRRQSVKQRGLEPPLQNIVPMSDCMCVCVACRFEHVIREGRRPGATLQQSWDLEGMQVHHRDGRQYNVWVLMAVLSLLKRGLETTDTECVCVCSFNFTNLSRGGAFVRIWAAILTKSFHSFVLFLDENSEIVAYIS